MYSIDCQRNSVYIAVFPVTENKYNIKRKTVVDVQNTVDHQSQQRVKCRLRK